MYDYNLIDYVPDYLRDNDEFLQLIDCLQLIANDIKYFVDTFNDLVDIDTVPELFLPKLSYLLTYPIKYDIDMNYQREMIKRMILVYKNKGTDNDILMAANNGDNPGWLGYNIFHPNYGPYDNKAKLMYTVDKLFRWDVSSYSGDHRFSDGTYWRSGVLQLEMDSATPTLRDAIMKVIPAGVRFYLKVNSNMGDEGEKPTFGKWVPKLGIILRIQPRLIQGFTDGIRWDTDEYTTGKNLWSGSKKIKNLINLTISNYATMRREVSLYRGTVTPTREVLPYLPPDEGLDTQWGGNVVQILNPRDIDAGLLSDTTDRGLVDSGILGSGSLIDINTNYYASPPVLVDTGYKVLNGNYEFSAKISNLSHNQKLLRVALANPKKLNDVIGITGDVIDGTITVKFENLKNDNVHTSLLLYSSTTYNGSLIVNATYSNCKFFNTSFYDHPNLVNNDHTDTRLDMDLLGNLIDPTTSSSVIKYTENDTTNDADIQYKDSSGNNISVETKYLDTKYSG